jgi:hypothetical protein
VGILKDCAELLLDTWRHIKERSSLALLQATAAHVKGWSVDQWYLPIDAAEKFGIPGLQGLLRYLEAAKQEQQETRAELREHLKVWAELREYFKDRTQTPSETREIIEARERFRVLHKQYKREKMNVQECMKFIFLGLNAQLANGELIARGFQEPCSHGSPYLTISRYEWLIIELKAPDRAEGAGVSYAGVTIGEVGTRSFFRPH